MTQQSTKAENRREKNRETIERTEYNYVWIKGSPVFHRRGCHACLNARGPAVIRGSVYFEAGAEERRPCRICKPVPLLMLAPVTDRELEESESRKEEKFNTYTGETINAKLITGECAAIKRGGIVGWCHSTRHPGALSRELLKEHECVERGCCRLERNCQSPYWAALEERKRALEARKEKLRAEKLRKAAECSELRQLRDCWQSYLDDMGSDMYIVRVLRDTPSRYRVFYVSDNAFADGNRYPEFLDVLKFLHPYYKINLRHIRDYDGSFVTNEVYRQRSRKK